MRTLLMAAVLLLPGLVRAENYRLKDKGGFLPQGQRVEFADRFGWRAYHVDFEFGLDQAGRDLTRRSKLTISILRRDGSVWSHTCRAKGREAMTANVNFLFGKGISVVAECRIPEDEFARAVDLHKEDVGLPYLVFQAMIHDGKVLPGAQRGLYFLPGGQIHTSELNSYLAALDDPAGLAVIFSSN